MSPDLEVSPDLGASPEGAGFIKATVLERLCAKVVVADRAGKINVGQEMFSAIKNECSRVQEALIKELGLPSDWPIQPDSG